MHRFTSEFGMGSGGSNALWSSRNSGTEPSFDASANWVCDSLCVVRTFGSLRLHTPQSGVLSDQQIAWVLYGQASRAISIG